MKMVFYAVKIGKNPGIYETWKECQEQVIGFKGSKYKKFNTYDEAKNFIEGKGDFQRPEEDNINDNEMIAYVDGSFDIKKKTYSYGAVILTNEGKETYSGRKDDEELALMRNVSGEIEGAMFAMDMALRRGKDTLYIYYDYAGIEHWAKGEWKTNKEGTKNYKKYYDQIKEKLNVIFVKVQAHSGVKYNEEADKLAKEAIIKPVNS
jgi:ribonuclease HI